MKLFRPFQAIFPAESGVVGQHKLLDVVSVGRLITIAEQGQLQITRAQAGSELGPAFARRPLCPVQEVDVYFFLDHG